MRKEASTDRDRLSYGHNDKHTDRPTEGRSESLGDVHESGWQARRRQVRPGNRSNAVAAAYVRARTCGVCSLTVATFFNSMALQPPPCPFQLGLSGEPPGAQPMTVKSGLPAHHKTKLVIQI